MAKNASGLPDYFLQGVIVPDSLNNPDSTKVDLIYPFRDFTGNPYLDNQDQSPLFLNTPENIQRNIVYNPVTNTYEFESKIGDFTYRPPTVMDFDDYQEYEQIFEKALKEAGIKLDTKEKNQIEKKAQRKRSSTTTSISSTEVYAYSR